MKKLVYVLLVFAGGITTSCETCVTCSYTTLDGIEVVSEELCGNKDETNALVKEYEDSALVHRSAYHCNEDY